MILSIVSAIVIFAVLIVVHEAGHFFVAKRMGVRVIRFSIGYPPRVWGFRRGETDYSFGATPLGGYVRMLGDEIAEEPSAATLEGYIKELELDLLDGARHTGWLAASGKQGEEAIKAIADELVPAGADRVAPERAQAVLGHAANAEQALLVREITRAGSVKLAREQLCAGRPSAFIEGFNARAFPSQPLRRRIAIVLAGPAANILFAPLLMAAVMIIGMPMTLPVLGTIRPNLPAATAGLKTGDRVVAVNGKAIKSWDDLSVGVRGSDGKPLELAIQRPAGAAVQSLTIAIQPKLASEPMMDGTKSSIWIIGVEPRGDEITRHEGPLKAVGLAVGQTWNLAESLIVGIVRIFDGTTPARKALGGPIMIAQMAGREARQGFAEVALFMVMLSLELGIINLFPVPLLDGGHLLFFVIEGIRGKPLKLRHREIAMEVGLFLLVILMAFVILNDISRLIG
ncbi:MAG: RIP metalloprotease RseP [Candidatus Binataceae bacterium]|nr:RIP metalloprotease RseP [Candidatus Binataceae bacterium]